MKASFRAAAALCVLLAVLSGCGSGHGTPRQRVVNSHTCSETSAPNWGIYWGELTYDYDVTRGCPYVVDSAGSPVQFEIKFHVEPRTSPQPWYDASFGVWNNQGTLKASGSSYYFYQIDAYGRLEATISTTYSAGTGTSPYRDSTYFVVSGGFHSPYFPWVRTKIAGTIRTLAPALTGDTYVVSGYPQAWQAYSSDEPGSYRYQWSVDGQLVSGATADGLWHTLTPGEHSISVEIRLSDDVVYVRQLAVTAVDCGGPYIC